jgi:hypothetical protein
METPYEYYNNKLGVKIKFLIFDRNFHPDTLGLISYKALNGRMNSQTCVESQLRNASWSGDALALYSSLSQDWKDSLTMKFGNPKTEIKRSFFASHYEADRKAFDFFAAYTYGADNKKLDLKLIETYTYNASVLNAVIKCKDNRKAYIKALGATQIDLWQSLTNDVNCFREVEHALPTTSRGLRIRYNEYVKHGYVSLISGRLQNSNASKVKDDDQMALIDELLAKHTNLDYTQVANIYNSVAERLYWKTITPQTVANRKQDSNIVVYAGRNGATALSNNMLMQNKRTAPTKPMLYWTMDGWDAELLYQKTEIDAKGKPNYTFHNRLTVIMVVDPFNKYIIGYAIGTHETPGLIKEALRNAFQHSQELFGAYYRPYQLQSDNYAKSKLTPLYEACSVHYTPAKVKNAKSKIIEPFFNRFNKEYCQMMDNWSGHNVNSGSKSQPNTEYMNKIKNSYPDERGCRQQLISAIEMDRAKKQQAYVGQWNEVSTEFKSELSLPMYLRYLGETTNYTNRLQGQGLTPTINGQTLTYDSFDLNFRKLAHLDWAVQYDPQDLSKVLVTNANSRSGKLVDIVGTYEFLLEQKHIQPMALAERTEGDALKLTEVKNYNSNVLHYITEERQSNIQVLEEMFTNPLLNDTLAKHLLTDSRGQHKDRKSENRLQAKTQHLIEVQATSDKKELSATWSQDQDNYNKQKIDYSNYID